MKKIKLAASILALCFLCSCSPAAKDNSRDRDEDSEMDYGVWHPYVIDVNTGRQLTNELILDIAGVDGSRIHDLATDAIMDGLNYYYMNTGTYYSNGNPMFFDGEVSLDG